ncbi:MAG: SPOR domain-containing protein [Moraxellaceae bacterium]|nr:SPOR domain-containing protein [Moraxellaceae bacterium]
MLSGLLVSLTGLVVVVLLLAWQKGPGPLVQTLQTPEEKAASTVRFTADFGRLSDLVPFAGGVSPVAAAVVPIAHGPEFRDKDWVRAQSPDSWSLQVLASQDESTVKRFLSGLEDRANYVYFVHPQDGQTWYVVTTGSYSSREMALGSSESMRMPDGARPFPRSMGSYQDALAAAEAAAAATVDVAEEVTPAPVPVPDEAPVQPAPLP